MKILVIFIFFILLKEIVNESKKLRLSYSYPYYYISLEFDHYTNETNFIFANIIPISLIPTLECKICSKFKFTNSNLTSIKQNINFQYYHYNFTGNLYNNIVSIDNFTSELNFLGFDNVTYKSNFSDNGIFSLSYLNFNFNTTRKIFALKYLVPDFELQLGDYEKKYISNYSNLKTYNVTLEGDNSNEQVLKSIWYLKFSNLTLNSSDIQQDIFNSSKEFKLSFDMGTDKFYIPKKIFFDNMHLIFPENSHCQLHPEGYFICQCGKSYKSKFANFIFKNNDNEIFIITPSDYIKYERGLYIGTCIAEIKVNYENDLFIAGNGIFKNHYSIFDVDNKTFMVYQEEEQDNFITYFIIFLILVAFLSIIIFGIYFCWKKWKVNNRNNDDSQESINQIQGESSEETE